MRRNNFNLVIFFGIMFLLGGFITCITVCRDYFNVNQAEYKQTVNAVVCSVDEDFEWVRGSTKRNYKRKYWATEEKIEVEGHTFTYNGKYYDAPGETITHTVISNDGITWEVNDTNSYDVFISGIVGVICILVGGFSIRFGLH